jgi:hypothetical protein
LAQAPFARVVLIVCCAGPLRIKTSPLLDDSFTSTGPVTVAPLLLHSRAVTCTGRPSIGGLLSVMGPAE